MTSCLVPHLTKQVITWQAAWTCRWLRSQLLDVPNTYTDDDRGKWSGSPTGDWLHESHLPLVAAVTEVFVEEELLFTAEVLFALELEILVGPLWPVLPPLLVLSVLDEAITACDDDEDEELESLPERREMSDKNFVGSWVLGFLTMMMCVFNSRVMVFFDNLFLLIDVFLRSRIGSITAAATTT